MEEEGGGGDNCEDERWTEAMHRQFVDAIYEIGVSHASPSVIIENMSLAPAAPEQHESPSSAGTTSTAATSKSKNKLSERVKSHLQKYRKNKEKSKQEFLLEYDLWMQKALTVVGGVSAAARTSLVSTPAAVIEMVGETTATTTASSSMKAAKVDGDDSNKPKEVLGGALPAFLTYSVMLEEEHKQLVRAQRGAVGVPSVAASQQYQQQQQQQQLQPSVPSVAAAAMATNPSAVFPMARTTHAVGVLTRRLLSVFLGIPLAHSSADGGRAKVVARRLH